VSDKTEAEAVAEIARRADIATVELGPGVIGTQDSYGTVTAHDTEPYLEHPRRAKGTQELATEIAFAAYLELHGIEHMTAVYADQDELRLTAVLNEHQAGDDGREAGWRDWQASLQLEHGRAWDAWTAINEKSLTQAAFIDLLEDRIDDVLDPPSTTLLEIMSNFSANKTLTFRSAQALSNGAVQLMYDEKIDGGGAAGDMQVPERIELALDPIKGDDPVRVKARLRWRITDDGKLVIVVKLDRLDDVLELAWGTVVDRVTPAVAPFPVLEGKP